LHGSITIWSIVGYAGSPTVANHVIISTRSMPCVHGRRRAASSICERSRGDGLSQSPSPREDCVLEHALARHRRRAEDTRAKRRLWFITTPSSARGWKSLTCSERSGPRAGARAQERGREEGQRAGGEHPG